MAARISGRESSPVCGCVGFHTGLPSASLAKCYSKYSLSSIEGKDRSCLLYTSPSPRDSTSS
eukprot:9021349-Prorocentrum_lima.AAC.1